MNKGNSFMLGFLIGGVVSGLSILLSTPKTGVELRSTIKHSSQDLLERLTHLKYEAKHFLHTVEQSSKEGKVLVKDFVDDVQKTVNHWKHAIEPNQKNIQREIAEIEKTLLSLEQTVGRHQVD
ncbi:YtxH domain-containing protein [Bacillus salitolerans]|uniref:YtxH domain-containing protein n=1 Tax=Bacillus salitolerans TaxID=1437434 RepID=A0ABW4LWC1_9BACI